MFLCPPSKVSSHIVSEQQSWLQVDSQGNTQLVNQIGDLNKYSFTRVRTGNRKSKGKGGQSTNGKMTPFQDYEYEVRKQRIVGNGDIAATRLSQLYSRNYRPPLFQESLEDIHPPSSYLSTCPAFLCQLELLPTLYYKSLFVTQTWQESGKYQLMVIEGGRWELETIDDVVPFNQKTGQVLWSIDMQQPWKILLCKAFAKKYKGYNNIQAAPPFAFLSIFYPPQWKYFNIAYQSTHFLQYYKGKTDLGLFILKSKNGEQVNKAGLIAGEACYQLQDILSDGKKSFIVKVRCVRPIKWTGKYSVIDPLINTQFNKESIENQKSKIKSGEVSKISAILPASTVFTLSHTFMLTQADFRNLFSSVHICSLHHKIITFSNSYHFRIEPNTNSAVYLSFDVVKEGFFDFGIWQPETNKIEKKGTTRYLQFKNILVRDIEFTNKLNSKISQKEQPSKLSNKLSQIAKSLEDYNPHRYQRYQIDYSPGYTDHDSHFVSILPGHYILRIRTQTLPKLSNFIVSYACHQKIIVKEEILDKPETRVLLADAVISMAEKVPHTWSKQDKLDCISFGNTFGDIGYGFIVVRLSKKATYSLCIEINPKCMRLQGYNLKNQFKAEREPFGIKLMPGESTAIVLKKIQDLQNYVWPPTGYRLSRKPL